MDPHVYAHKFFYKFVQSVPRKIRVDNFTIIYIFGTQTEITVTVRQRRKQAQYIDVWGLAGMWLTFSTAARMVLRFEFVTKTELTSTPMFWLLLESACTE